MTTNHESSARRPELEASVSSSVGPQASEERLLDAIMHQTAAVLDEKTLAQTVDLPRLREVALRHPSDSLTFDPILIELLEAILETRLPQISQLGGARKKMARAIAQPLFENPVSRGRLELLWSQLLDNTQ